MLARATEPFFTTKGLDNGTVGLPTVHGSHSNQGDV
jgi:hypothetical protein